jgi:hypothetical protein
MRGGLLLLAACANAQWDDWECPGFPCFIVNKNDPHNTTAGRQETCGPIAQLSPCNALGAEKHPCAWSQYWVCDQTTCLQGTQAKCKTFCVSLIPPYSHDCENACERYCST